MEAGRAWRRRSRRKVVVSLQIGFRRGGTATVEATGYGDQHGAAGVEMGIGALSMESDTDISGISCRRKVAISRFDALS